MRPQRVAPSPAQPGDQSTAPRRGLLRLGIAVGISVGLVTTAIVVPTYSLTGPSSVSETYEANRPVQAADGHWHKHDPERKNDITQASAQAGTEDPTTATQARANAAQVARGRTSTAPALARASLRTQRRTTPQNRYAVAGGATRWPAHRYGSRPQIWAFTCSTPRSAPF